MSIESHDHETTHRELVVHKRDLIIQRLVRALDALDRKRHAITDVVHDVGALLPHASSTPPERTELSSPASERVRTALIGALVGGVAVVALCAVIQHRQRERNRPLRVLQRAWFKYAMPPQPSLFKRLVSDALGSLVASIAHEAASGRIHQLLEARSEEHDEPERASESPHFVTEPVTLDPGALQPREATLPPPGIAPPEPISPLPTPFREFT